MNLNVLNDKQKEAVKHTEGPLLVLAGAGSGKTKVLTTRIVYLIEEKKIDPKNILAITFTNKAAKEMKERVINMIGSIGYNIQLSTFHSFGLMIMKEKYDLLGYDKNFTIADSDDSLTVVKKIVKDMDLDPKQYSPKAIRNKISGAKNELMTPEIYERYANTEYEKVVLDVYSKYERRLKVNNSMDFDDLLILPIFLMQKHPEILQKYQEKYKYILIDEYQDTNEAQYILTKMISARYRNICVVGDGDQSIYSFRGSNYRNILNFEKDYKEAKIITLEENYRSTKNILNVANDIIKNNKLRKDKDLWTSNEDGLKIKYYKTENEKDEAFTVLKAIKNLLDRGVKLSDIAVLYRTNVQSRNMEEVLLRENIPYKVIGSFYFYKRKEIKDLIAYLKLIYNNNDDNSLNRIINVPKRKIGAKTIENLAIKAINNDTSMYKAIESGKELEFKKVIENIKEKSEDLTLTELIEEVLKDTGMKSELESEKTLESETKLEHLEEFKTITKEFEERNGIVSLGEFLDSISLVSDAEEYKNNNEVVTLMTVHSSKGLEFDNIFIIGLEEGMFPHSNAFDCNEDIEEERRLCYVAVTRAKKNLYLINAKKRTIYGKDNYNLSSRFIDEINQDYLDIFTSEVKEKKFNKDKMIDPNAEYLAGDKIIHETYGEGIVVDVKKNILTIAFPNPIGIKIMIKGHKSFRKVS